MIIVSWRRGPWDSALVVFAFSESPKNVAWQGWSRIPENGGREESSDGVTEGVLTEMTA